MLVTMAQVVKFCDMYPRMKSTGIKVSGLGMVDFAMNYSNLLPTYKKFSNVSKVSQRINEFKRKFNETRLRNQIKITNGEAIFDNNGGIAIADGEKYTAEIAALEKEYAEDIRIHNEAMAKSEEMLSSDQEYHANIVLVDKSSISVDDTKSGFEEALATITFMLK